MHSGVLVVAGCLKSAFYLLRRGYGSQNHLKTPSNRRCRRTLKEVSGHFFRVFLIGFLHPASDRSGARTPMQLVDVQRVFWPFFYMFLGAGVDVFFVLLQAAKMFLLRSSVLKEKGEGVLSRVFYFLFLSMFLSRRTAMRRKIKMVLPEFNMLSKCIQTPFHFAFAGCPKFEL